MIESILPILYGLIAGTCGIPLAIGAYFLYRYTPLWYRMIPSTIFVAAGFWGAHREAHGFNTFSFAAFVYSIVCVTALWRKSVKQEKRLRDDFHFDWMAVLAFSVAYFVLSTSYGVVLR